MKIEDSVWLSVSNYICDRIWTPMRVCAIRYSGKYHTAGVIAMQVRDTLPRAVHTHMLNIKL
jgi:hypothetical protein